MKKILMKVSVLLLVCVLAAGCISAVYAADGTVTAAVKNSKGKTLATFEVAAASASDGLQDALDYVRDNATAKNIMTVELPDGTYTVSGSLNVYSNTTLDLSGVTLKRSGGASTIRFGRGTEESTGYDGYENISILGAKGDYAVLDGSKGTTSILRFAHANNITVKYVEFTNVTWAHHAEFAGCSNVTFDSCRFTGFNPAGKEDENNHEAIQMDILTEGHFPNYGKYDGTVNKNISITNNVFENLNRGVGVHSGQVGKYMDNIKITGNTFKNISGYAIVATNYTNSVISDNVMTDCGSGIFFRHITPAYVNYYAGSSKTVSTDMNCVISNNTISLKATAFDNTRYGINLYGRVVSKNTKQNGGTIPAADYRVGNVTVTGNTITSTTYANGIWLQGTIDSTVSDNTVTFKISKKASDSCDGIKLEDSSGNTVSKNTVTESSKTVRARTGIYVRNSDKNTFQSNTVKKMKQDGIYLDDSDGCTVTKNTIESVKKHGIYIDAGSGTSKKYTAVTKNTVKSAGKRGICINDKSYATVSGNTVTKSGDEGIYVGAKAVAKISKNTVKTSGDHGIYINTGATAKTIEGNTITSAKNIGIYVTSKSKADTISKNTITSPKKQGIYINNGSTAKKITGNTVKKATRGISVGGSTVTTIQSNTVSSSKTEGIYIASKATVTNILKNKISSSGKHGIHISGSSKVKKVESNTISVSKEHGIYVKDKATATAISKNTITDSTESGIRVLKGSVSKITGNTIKKSKNKVSSNNAIFLTDVSGKISAITSNKISNCKGHGIYLSASTTVTTLQKNTVKKAGVHGIYIKTGCKAVKLSKNTVSSVGGEKVKVQ